MEHQQQRCGTLGGHQRAHGPQGIHQLQDQIVPGGGLEQGQQVRHQLREPVLGHQAQPQLEIRRRRRMQQVLGQVRRVRQLADEEPGPVGDVRERIAAGLKQRRLQPGFGPGAQDLHRRGPLGSVRPVEEELMELPGLHRHQPGDGPGHAFPAGLVPVALHQQRQHLRAFNEPSGYHFPKALGGRVHREPQPPAPQVHALRRRGQDRGQLARLGIMGGPQDLPVEGTQQSPGVTSPSGGCLQRHQRSRGRLVGGGGRGGAQAGQRLLEHPVGQNLPVAFLEDLQERQRRLRGEDVRQQDQRMAKDQQIRMLDHGLERLDAVAIHQMQQPLGRLVGHSGVGAALEQAADVVVESLLGIGLT